MNKNTMTLRDRECLQDIRFYVKMRNRMHLQQHLKTLVSVDPFFRMSEKFTQFEIEGHTISGKKVTYARLERLVKLGLLKKGEGFGQGALYWEAPRYETL